MLYSWQFGQTTSLIVAVIAGVGLPYLTRRNPSLLPEEGDDEQTHIQRLRLNLHQWREEALASGKSVRLPRRPILLRDIWMGAMVLFTILMFSSFWISTVPGAITMISLVGICWSVACWVPFAIIMEAGILSVLLDISSIDCSDTVRQGDDRIPVETSHFTSDSTTLC
jgi:solute carrier family 45 protein 1/2/4